jgi:hypothetical protein
MRVCSEMQRRLGQQYFSGQRRISNTSGWYSAMGFLRFFLALLWCFLRTRRHDWCNIVEWCFHIGWILPGFPTFVCSTCSWIPRSSFRNWCSFTVCGFPRRVVNWAGRPGSRSGLLPRYAVGNCIRITNALLSATCFLAHPSVL